MKRFLSSRDPGTSDAGFGPSLELRVHTALLPLVRVGLYALADISPQSNAGTRHLYAGGLHFKVTSPVPQGGSIRLWAVTGFGYAVNYAESFTSSVGGGAGGTATAFFPGASGSFFEVPLGIGAGYKVARGFELTTELVGRVGFGFGGDVYPDHQGSAQGFPTLAAGTGNDVLAISLTAGVSFDL
jgi:hypothetical protein